MFIETIKAISGLCLVLIVANVFTLFESQFPKIETWFYSLIGSRGVTFIIDFIFGLGIVISIMRWFYA